MSSFAMSVIDIAKRIIKYYAQSNGAWKRYLIDPQASKCQKPPSTRLGVSRVAYAYAFLVYMLSPLPRRSGWAYCFAHSPQPHQPSPKGLSGRPAHRPFRGLLGVHSRYGLRTRAVTVYCDTLTRGFSHFVTSMTAPVASGWSGCRVGFAPTGTRRLFTAHTRNGH